MSTRKSVPPALEPYLKLPPEISLILLTSTLGCSTTWLTSRFVGSILASKQPQDETGDSNAVVLVSWLRDETFWRGEIRKATGQDTTKLSTASQFAFIDGLTAVATSTNPERALSTIEQTITTALQKLSDQGKRLTLILDAPDTLLATATTSTQALNHFILTLRSKVHATILTLSADLPLLTASTPSLSHSSGSGNPTPLESECAAFLVAQAHAASFVMGVRELETGAARDVSGVLRVTGGGGDADDEWEGDGGEVGNGNGEEVREMEALFLVGRDGGVKVFERGSAG